MFPMNAAKMQIAGIKSGCLINYSLFIDLYCENSI